MKIIIVGIVLVMAAIGSVMGTRSGEKDDKTVTSHELQEELNKERRSQGKQGMPAINSGTLSTSTYARMDKSWKSVPDFFKQLIRGRRE